MKIKILGAGCSKCTTLIENTQTALTHLGMTAEIIKVTDYADIAAYGVMSTPALVIDDKVVAVGKVLLSADIEKLLR